MPSGVIESFACDEERRLRVIRFVSGRVYGYADVPAGIATGFDTAGSRGRYRSEAVRDRFAFVRMFRGQAGYIASGRS